MSYIKKWLNLDKTKSIYTNANEKLVCLLRHRNHLCRIEQAEQASNARRNKPLVALTQQISQLSRDGEVVNARKIFDQMAVRDSVSWNVMIRCYVENKMVEHAREMFDRMPERTSFTWNTMIMGYIKSGKTHIALKLFVIMPGKDVVSWTATVTGMCRASLVDDARNLFKQMPDPNAVSWSSMISGCQQHGYPNESLHAFKEMLLSGTQPIPHSFTSALSACADLATVSLSEQIYSQILKRGFHSNTHVSNSAISTFVKTGNFHYALRVFLNLDKPDTVSWNAVITGFAQHGHGLEAMMIFHQMQKARFSPDGVSFMGVLHGCSHCGLVREGIQYFQSMKTDYGIAPGIEHFSAMVDLYARAGKLKEAYKVIADMPFEPTAILWRTLLNGCRVKGDVELGVRVAEKILKIEPYSSSACLMVIDIFALAGKWNEVAQMRRRMRDTDGRKELGCSWIDVKGRSNVFATGDRIHLEGDRIVAIIELLAYEVARYCLGLEGVSDGLE